MIGLSPNYRKLTSRVDDMSSAFEHFKEELPELIRIGPSKQYQQLDLQPIVSVEEGEDSYEKLKEVL